MYHGTRFYGRAAARVCKAEYIRASVGDRSQARLRSYFLQLIISAFATRMLAWATELLLNEPSVMMGLAVAALAWLFYVIHCHSQMLARGGGR